MKRLAEAIYFKVLKRKHKLSCVWGKAKKSERCWICRNYR